MRKQSYLYDANNPEKSKARYLRYRHSNIQLCRSRDENYRLRKMDKDAAKTAKRRAAKRQRTPKWLTVQQNLEIESFYTEAKQLEIETGVKHHVDHIVPLIGEQVCGLHVPWNLRAITATDNLIKSNKHIGEIKSA